MAGLTLRSGLAAGSGLSNSSGLSLGGGLSPSVGTPAFDPAATAFFAAVVSAGGSVSAGRKTLYNNFYLSLRSISAGLTAWDRIWILAAENTQAAAIDLIGLQSISLVAVPTFTVDRGYAGNGTTSYVNTNYVPATNGVGFIQNSAHMMSYTNVFAVQACFGSNDNAADAGMDCPFSDGHMYARINCLPSGGGQGTGLTTGCFIGDRIDGSNIVNCVNGTDQGTDASASTGRCTLSLLAGAFNNAGTIVSFNASRVAALSAGASLGSPGRANFTTAVTTLLTAIGAN